MVTSSALQTSSAPTKRRFSVEEYHRLTELGILGPHERVELIRGELIQLVAKGVAHETCIRRLLRHLPLLLQSEATLQCQSPIALSDSEPEPDFSIVITHVDDYADRHPTAEDTLLVIEVSDSSLDFDQTVKLSLYAEAKIRHYWIFNLIDQFLEVYQDPAQLSTGQFGYLSRRIVPRDEAIALPFPPHPMLQLAQLLYPQNAHTPTAL